jgi:SHS2 domain-containing protein
MKRFEEIPHTADWSFRAFGRDLRELFENAAHALFGLESAQARPDANPTARVVAVSKLDAELWRKVSIVLTNDSDLGMGPDAHRRIEARRERRPSTDRPHPE